MAKKTEQATGEAPAKKVHIQRIKPKAAAPDAYKNDSYPPLKAKKAKTSKKSAKATPAKTAKAPKVKKLKVDHALAVTQIPNSGVSLKTNVAPTVEIATQLQSAFDHFNTRLFEGKLEPVIFTNVRLKKSLGHFWAKSWTRRTDLKGKVHEIGMDFARLRTAEDHGDKLVLSTLVHEMCHELIEMMGVQERGHGKYWVAAMLMIGLEPIILDGKGVPTGKATGSNSSHKIIDGGKFDVAAKELLASGFKFVWANEPMPEDEKKPKAKKKKAGGKFKYEATCGNAFWGKSGIKASCQCGCDSEFAQLEKPDEEATEGEGDDA